MRAESRPLWLLRVLARAPRFALVGTCAVLALAGLRSAVASVGTAARVVSSPSVPVADTGVTAFAEAFTRAYLTYRGPDLAAHERALAPFVGGDLDADAGLQPAGGRSQRVSWTATSVVLQEGPGRWRVTVAVALAGEGVGLRYLSVPVARDRAGGLVVEDYPALVGPPPRAGKLSAPAESELTDQALADVVARGLDNYLRGATENLRADLAPGARVTTPAPPLRLVAVEALAWRIPGRLLVATVTANDPAGARMRLRFPLSVERRDRWYLRSIGDPATTPTTEGPPR